MNELFCGLECIRAYIDDFLVICNGLFWDHLNKTKIVSKKLKAAGFKINTEKSFLPEIILVSK